VRWQLAAAEAQLGAARAELEATAQRAALQAEAVPAGGAAGRQLHSLRVWQQRTIALDVVGGSVSWGASAWGWCARHIGDLHERVVRLADPHFQEFARLAVTQQQQWGTACAADWTDGPLPGCSARMRELVREHVAIARVWPRPPVGLCTPPKQHHGRLGSSSPSLASACTGVRYDWFSCGCMSLARVRHGLHRSSCYVICSHLCLLHPASA
jgi:hypothetical protein